MDPLRLRTPYDSPPKAGLEKAFSDVELYAVAPKVLCPSESAGVDKSSAIGHIINMHASIYRYTYTATQNNKFLNRLKLEKVT